jgi:hypothetical protein
LTPQQIIAELTRYEGRISGILARFRDYKIADPDADIFSQLVIETADPLTDALGSNAYSTNIMEYYNYGVRNSTGRPSQKSVTEIPAVIRAAHTRLARNPGVLDKKQGRGTYTRKGKRVYNTWERRSKMGETQRHCKKYLSTKPSQRLMHERPVALNLVEG